MTNPPHREEMLSRSHEARAIWQRFAQLPGASVDGVAGIASEHAIEGLIATIRRERPRAILELGSGIGTLTYAILKTVTDLELDRDVSFRFDTVENEPFCRQALHHNLAVYEGRYRLLDSTRTLGEQDSYDLIVVDGGADLPNDMGIMEFGGRLAVGGSILVEGSRTFQRDLIERWYGDRDCVYVKSSPFKAISSSRDGTSTARNKPYHLYRFEPSSFRRLQLRALSTSVSLIVALRRRSHAICRVTEIATAGLALLLCLPVLLLCALLIRLTSRGPVLFRQERVGLGGRRFTLFKLRTMSNEAQCLGPSVTSAGDPRITAVGRVLRRFKLDELPQLWNILRGDLSWVGPRPEVPCHVDLGDPRWQEVLRARPGLTDPVTVWLRQEESLLASAPGDPEQFYRDELLPRKLEGYCAYLRRRTCCSDLRVLLNTLVALVWPAGRPKPSLDQFLRPE